MTQFKELWASLEKNVFGAGKAKALGLCDIETDTLKEIYNSAEVAKPNSITVNLR